MPEGRITAPVMGSFTAGAAPGFPRGRGFGWDRAKTQHTITKCALGETLCAPRRAATLSELPLPAKVAAACKTYPRVLKSQLFDSAKYRRWSKARLGALAVVARVLHKVRNLARCGESWFAAGRSVPGCWQHLVAALLVAVPDARDARDGERRRARLRLGHKPHRAG